jgi:glycosyltransferase involved in cell wall biosynthesis
MGVPDERLAVIYYGPDEAKFDPAATAAAELRAEFGWPSGTPLVGMVAYFYPELPRSRWIPAPVQERSVKSQEDLIRAALLVLREFPSAKFLLVGSGWEEGGRAYLLRMQKLVTELGLERSVIFTGFRTDVAAILRDINVAVQPSLSENLGGTIESLLMECPTVATRVGGMTDSVVDGKTGVLVAPSEPNSLAEGILRVLRDPIVAKRCGAAGRQRMLAKFTLRKTVDSLAELYRRKSMAGRSGYRTYVVGIRFVIGSLLCLLIVLRYVVVDATMLRLWDRRWPSRRKGPSVQA